MKKLSIIKKFSILILLVFCFTSMVGGFFALTSTYSASADDDTDTWTSIASAYELYFYISSGDYSNNIKLMADIDMSEYPLTSTIGTTSNPFTGKFDGNGYTISNITIDLSDEDTQSSVGLFGALNGATISNVAISGTVNITPNSSTTLNVGVIAGYAENSTFTNVQITATVNLEIELNQNINYGGIVGLARDCSFTNILLRQSSGFGGWTLSRNDSRILAFGGLVGRMINSKIKFAVVQTSFSVDVEDSFVGTLNLGGVVGTVSETSSQIINIAIENSYNISQEDAGDSATINVGEVAGAILTPTPSSSNIAYIHYKSNSGIDRFGDMGNFSYTDSANYNYITTTPDSYKLSNLTQQNGEYLYFTNQTWAPLEGAWDFDTVWCVNSYQISLQNFQSSFTVSVSGLDSSVISMTSTLSSGYKYGDSVVLQFEFVSEMQNYYKVSSLMLGTTEVAIIYTNTSNGVTTYSLSDETYYSISASQSINDDGEVIQGFSITIKSINMATAGTYGLNLTQYIFKASITSKLFDDDEEEVSDVVPGYVYYTNSSNTKQESLTISDMVYGRSYSLNTRAQTGTPYAFSGWYMINSDGSETLLATSSILSFTFGQTEYFDSDVEIYAKYTMNACNVICILGDGVLKIVFSETTEVTSSNTTVAISKTDQSLKVEIYVATGYTFDYDSFITELSVYKSSTATFCTLRETIETDEYTYYHFVFDMTSLSEDYKDSFTINAQTTIEGDSSNSWIWWVVGGVAGAIVLIGIILIIVFTTRNRGGKISKISRGSSSMKKKNYKNMYY